MFYQQNIIWRKLRALALRTFNYIENNGNTDLSKNGEKKFLNNLFSFYQMTKSQNITCFDIGANIGNYTEILLKMSLKYNISFKIHLFEPLSSSFEVLETKFNRYNRIILNKKGISTEDGIKKIFYDINGSTLASLYKRNLNSYNIEMNKSEKVETIRLDRYIDENGIKHIDFMKIDIEGHELEAIKSLGDYLNKNFIDFILFEYGGANLDSHTSLMELYETFEKNGFVIAKVFPKGLDIRPYKAWMDNFTYSNYVAISNNILEDLNKK